MIEDEYPKSPLVFHIPHSSTEIPHELRSRFLLNDRQLSDELLAMTDRYTDELFATDLGPFIRFPVSRLVLDPERFVRDAEEPMVARGMGVVYTQTSSGGLLRRTPSPVERDELIRRYYDPHHQALERAVTHAIRSYGEAIVVDCHSYPSEALPYEQFTGGERPDICIGTDSHHTPEGLSAAVQKAAEKEGLSIALNTPFSGTLIPGKFYRSSASVFGIMLEVNRSIYMNEATGERTDKFSETQTNLTNVVGAIAAWQASTVTMRHRQ